MRIGEVLALKLQDIDIDLTSISINQTMTKDKYDKIMIGNTTKTKRGKRKIKVSDWHCISAFLFQEKA